MLEIKNVYSKCIDMESIDEVVLHEVGYHQLNNNEWLPKTITLMATDPLQAIKLFEIGRV
jgi:hypothetical protein